MVEVPAVGLQFDFGPDLSTGTLFLWLVFLETGLVGSYVLTTDAIITDPLVLIYPFVWINASLLAVYKTNRPVGPVQKRLGAGTIALGYFVVLGYFGGLFGTGAESVALHLNWAPPPGYAPALLFENELFKLVLEPYTVIGYLTLAYFVYATVLDAAAGAVPGLLGLFSCLSCSWPILGTIVTSIFGSGSAVTAFALSQTYGIGTVVFVTALGLLYYRPLI
ncbi:DUF7546 family protein [Halodesulfurarchaeum sp.]|uniref:DUF7546 family protein n=1 Tax=Halodesulfurarchaeum sp. TaxID=1980530 RepID=UPI001BC6A949|nr:hypothetical protein [Halodesulfurarchaeum sp.]